MSEEMMQTGYETREEMIRDHWKRYGYHWDVEKWPRLKLPIRNKAYPFMALVQNGDAGVQPEIALEYSFHRGTLDGRPAYRITCEGFVLEEAPL